MSDGIRFGEVAEVYDEVRPGYSPELAGAIARYHGSAPADVVEVGAGTGKGTEVLRALGGRLTCIEPDERMAALLRARFPDVAVLVRRFEDGGAGPADVLGCALAWHWLNPGRRNRLAFDALRPGGTLAIFGHRYAYADPGHERAFDEAFASVDPRPAQPRAEPHDDVLASGLWADVRAERSSRHLALDADAYLRLVRTFGPFRAKSAPEQERTLGVLAATLQRLGGGTVLDLRATLTLARRA
ncbi:class I SAM-dependent methyltransferase [Dactylosporangium sp. CA-233914]|uniref:class I SAM-dependent methyltransferase n=1 Tax=Dactylosporangium sp. CA-233914 TaxID=3239934 RepID=UPI003D8E4466